MSELGKVVEKVAIVILNWNGQKYLEQFLPSVVKNSGFEFVKIYVADNGSTDNSVTFLKENYPNIQLILFDQNYGFTGGYNRALEQINAKYFVILNSDVEVTSGWLQPIINFMDQNEEFAACQPKIKAFAQKEYFEYAGAAGGFIDKYGYPFCRGRVLNKFEKDTGQYNKATEIFWATGACMVVRGDMFKDIGGFDDDFFAHMEEIDLCWRLKNEGKKIYYIPESVVYHVGGGTLPNNSPNKLYLNYRNNLFLLYKNLPSNKRFRTLIIRMILDGVSAFMYLFSFSFSFFFAVLKAHLHFYLSVKTLRKKRRTLVHQNNSYKHKQIYGKSIVFDFFIRKKHKFSDLKF